MIKNKNTLKGKLNVSIVKEYPELEEITVTPTLDEQELNPSKYGYSKVKIEGIPATNVTITPTTKEQKQEGIFKTVTVNAIKGQELNLNPSEEQQNYEGVFLGVNINPIQVEEITTDLDFSGSDAIEITAQEGAYIKKATINKDVNLTPENIKSGVSIAGISGDVADTSDADATSNDIIAGKTAYVANEKIAGTYIPLDTSDATATVEDIAKDKTAYVNGKKVVGILNVNVDNNAKINSNGLSVSTITSGTIKNFIRKLDFTNVNTSMFTTLSSSFDGMLYLEEIKGLDASNVTNGYNCCQNCSELINAEFLNTVKMTTMNSMFINCSKLEQVDINTIAVKLLNAFCRGCTNLKTISLNGLDKCTDISYVVWDCKKLENIDGFINLGKAYTKESENTWAYGLDLTTNTLLTHESLWNVINGLYDLSLTYNVANGGTLYTQSLKLGSINLAKLTTEEIAIATTKGWTVS